MTVQRLYYWEEEQRFEILAYREFYMRPKEDDPIRKFCQIIDSKEFQFGIALRASGRIDLYYNCVLVSQTT